MLSEEENAIKKLNEILKKWQEIVNIEDKTEREIEMSLYMEDMPFEEIKTVLNLITKLQKENEEKDKRINDLEFVLLDMVMQFANRVKTKGSNYALDTKGLSTLELAFNELGFDEMYPVKKANEKYKILEKKYYYEN